MQRALLLALVLLAVSTASAQPLPAVSACGPIDIPTAPTSPAAIRPGERTSVLVDVANGGSLPVTVTVSGSTTATGWTIEASPAPTSVAQGASQTFTFTLAAGSDATGPAILSIAASGTCETPLGSSCPGTACVAGSANTQVEVPLAPAEGFTLPGLGQLDIPLEYVIAAIVLVGIATAIPLAMRRKHAGIAAECPEPLKIVKPGRGTSFPIELRNPGKQGVTAHFEVGPVPEGWSAFMPLPEVQLAARETRSLWLMVRSPATAVQGDVVDVELRLRDQGGRNGKVVRVRAEVQGTAEG